MLYRNNLSARKTGNITGRPIRRSKDSSGPTLHTYKEATSCHWLIATFT